MLEEKKSNKILNVYANLQKVFVFCFFFSFILLFIYCLGFFTPYYDISTYNGLLPKTYAERLGIDFNSFKELYPDAIKSNSINGKYFTEFTNDVQNLNNMLFYFSIFGIIISLLLFIFRSHIRKRYYITNHIVTGLCSIYSLVTCIFLFIQLGKYENALNNVNYKIINAFYTNLQNAKANEIINHFSKSSMDFIYVIGRIVLVVILISTILLVLNDIAKIIVYKNKDKHELVDGEGK